MLFGAAAVRWCVVVAFWSSKKMRAAWRAAYVAIAALAGVLMYLVGYYHTGPRALASFLGLVVVFAILAMISLVTAKVEARE